MLAAIHIRQTRVAGSDLACASLAWTDGGRTHTTVFAHPGSGSRCRFAAGLDAFARLYETASGLGGDALAHISDADLRREIETVAASFPAVTMIGTGYGPLGLLLERASAVITDHVRALRDEDARRRQAEWQALPELTVATDASKSSRHRGVGVACVSEDGIYGQRVHPRCRSVLAGELLAIDLAIERFPKRRLCILTDSRPAIASLRMGRSDLIARCDGDAVFAVDRIRTRNMNGTVRLRWVRGHSGHPLNEIADRLAVAARRHHEAGIDTATRHTVADNIVAPLRRVAVAS